MTARFVYRVLWVAVFGLALALPLGSAPAQAGVQGSLAYISLTVYSPQGGPWFDAAGRTLAVVEWQDGNGAWHAVENWRVVPSGPVSWEVWPKDYNTGPFRWAVYAVYENWRSLGASTPFYLPGSDGQVVNVVVALTDLPAGGSGNPPLAPPGVVCTQPAHPDFYALWASYQGVLGCSTAPATQVPTIAEEAFLGGRMFWRSDTNEVYIVYDRRSDGAILPDGAWRLHTVQWDGSDPDGVHMSPPPGLFEPKRGFGWVWRNYLGGPSGPLGWALDKEYGYDNVARAQRFERGVMFRGSEPKTYVLLDYGQFYAQ